MRGVVERALLWPAIRTAGRYRLDTFRRGNDAHASGLDAMRVDREAASNCRVAEAGTDLVAMMQDVLERQTNVLYAKVSKLTKFLRFLRVRPAAHYRLEATVLNTAECDRIAALDMYALSQRQNLDMTISKSRSRGYKAKCGIAIPSTPLAQPTFIPSLRTCQSHHIRTSSLCDHSHVNIFTRSSARARSL